MTKKEQIRTIIRNFARFNQWDSKEVENAVEQIDKLYQPTFVYDEDKGQQSGKKNICINCGNPVGNDVFTWCDKCWDKHRKETII